MNGRYVTDFQRGQVQRLKLLRILLSFSTYSIDSMELTRLGEVSELGVIFDTKFTFVP